MEGEGRYKANTIEGFFNTIVKISLGQMKRKTFYSDNSCLNIYKMMIKMIDDLVKKEPDKIEYYSSMYEVADRFYGLMNDEKIRKYIIENDIRVPEFIRLYSEKILGKNKRNYDMSDMFGEDYIATGVEKITGKKAKKIAYRPEIRQKHVYYNREGQKITIEEIGKLYMKEWNGIGSYISKYRIQRQMEDGNVLTNNVYSNIILMNMDDPQYKNAVLDELLSSNNINLSNSKGYVGEIDTTPSELKEEKIGAERVSGAGKYFYKIDDKYSLKYDAKDLSAVMIYENMQKEQKSNTKKTSQEIEEDLR